MANIRNFNIKNSVLNLSKKHSIADVGVYGDDLSFASHEAYRLLRTNLIFSFTGEKACRVIGMVSSIKGEGKTTTSINLAYVLAENGARVCLVEGDMRMPQIAKRLDVKSKYGFSSVLTRQATTESALVEKQFKKFSFQVLVSGTMPPNPMELLSSQTAKDTIAELSNNFDYIIIDLPPIDVVADAIVLSDVLDGVVMVVSEGYVSKKLVTSAVRQLSMANIKILGFARTFVSSSGFNNYRSKYKYGGKYGYKYGYEDAAKKAGVAGGTKKADTTQKTASTVKTTATTQKPTGTTQKTASGVKTSTSTQKTATAVKKTTTTTQKTANKDKS